ncbi:anthranilate synthase component I family protein [Ancylomarina salipaludis]|uniref:Anthranilate synthase component 1 n=1 Tax=Ancylomarina salipaludis TaxID=2501299 RepID=A0A4Q1JKP2_9BACT|nr:anthranilate synthase component I family protein [Ancylomarina salipaludis]RXQ93923.1 anthranilate synthase component I family protein [Ancylomarina salipaludis]
MIQFKHHKKEMLADLITPVSMYLKLRDRFPQSILLESSDYHSPENASSFIALEPIANISLKNNVLIESIGSERKETPITNQPIGFVADQLEAFVKQFDLEDKAEINKANALFGYTSFDAVPAFENLNFVKKSGIEIPQLSYSLYRFIIEVNHFNNTLSIVELTQNGENSRIKEIEDLLRNHNIPNFKFSLKEEKEKSNMSDQDYLDMVEKGIKHCRRGDVFQIVLSRSFSQSYQGDDFNLYRALRSVNPSPYLFYFDCGSFRIMGSSPEAQIEVKNNKAYIHPIAGTFRRSGDALQDIELAKQLEADEKEQSEHVMLVDLARNDLSRNASNIKIETFREVQFYSHVIHLVSKVSGELPQNYNTFDLIGNTFPAGTLSGAPKYKAMELIDKYEPTKRGFYGGCIGSIGFNGEVNQAIMIRSFLSKDNTLYYQAGAGVVEKSKAENELNEVDNKLAALRKALKIAEGISK